jgi:hypothetical protein
MFVDTQRHSNAPDGKSQGDNRGNGKTTIGGPQKCEKGCRVCKKEADSEAPAEEDTTSAGQGRRQSG